MDLAGKAALLTGGARIGRHVAEALLARGCAVAVTYRASARAAAEVLERAKALRVPAAAVKVDLAKAPDLSRAVAATRKALGRLDILVNMASLYEKTPLAALADPRRARAALEKNFAVDAASAYDLSLLAARHMGKGGRIVNFTDWVAASGRPRYRGYLPYYAAKGAVKSLTEALALELAPKILVNAIAPGPILAPPGLSKSADREVRRQTPLGRWGGPAEIAKAVLFLIETDFVTGETLRVDGGRHLY